MDINNLQAFLSVAEFKSFSKAARHLHITQSAISKRVASLEGLLKIALFVRSHQGLEITEAGKLLIPFAKDAVTAITSGTEIVTKFETTKRIPLAIGIGYFFGQFCIPELLIHFTESFSDIDLTIRYLVPMMIIHALELREIEFGVNTVSKQALKDFKYIHLKRYYHAFAVSKDHPLANIQNPTLEDIVKYPAIYPPIFHPFRKTLDQFFKSKKLKPIVRYEAGVADTILKLCVNGHGWAIVPKDVTDEKLVKLYTHESLYSDYYIIYRKDHKLSPQAQKMIDLILEYVKV